MARVQGMRPTGEMLPQRVSHHREPAQPPPHRGRVPAQPHREGPVTNTCGLARQRRTDDLNPIPSTHQGVLGNQHVRVATTPADRTPKTATLTPEPEAHLALHPMAPRPQTRPASRAADPAAPQIRLDGGPVDTYDEHSGAPASSGRAPSRSVERSLSRGLLRVQEALTLPPPRPLLQTSPPARNPSTSTAAPPTRPPNHARLRRRQPTY